MILNLSKVKYAVKIIISKEQLMMQTILLTGMIIIGFIFSFFSFKIDDTINAHEDGSERTLVIREVVIEDKTFSQFINDIESIDAVEHVNFTSNEDDILIYILMEDYRDRSVVIHSLPKYVVSASIFTHKIEGLYNKINKVKFFGVIATLLLTLIYSFFYIGIFNQIIKEQIETTKVLMIIGFTFKDKIKIAQLPIIISLVFSNFAALVINRLVISPILNTTFRNIGFLESLGVGYHDKWMDYMIISFIVIITNVLIFGWIFLNFCFQNRKREVKKGQNLKQKKVTSM